MTFFCFIDFQDRKGFRPDSAIGFSYPSPFEIPESVLIRFDALKHRYEFEFDYPDNESIVHASWCSDPYVDVFLGTNSRRVHRIVTVQQLMDSRLASRIQTAINTEDCYDREPKLNRSAIQLLVSTLVEHAKKISEEAQKQTERKSCGGESLDKSGLSSS
jgi:hypothetical protein